MKRLLFFSDWKLQWKFLFIFFIFIILPMLTFSLFIYSQANQAVQLQAINNTKGHLEKINQNISAVLKDIENISSFMIYSKDVQSYLKTPNHSEYWLDLKELEEQINGFAVFHFTSKFYLHSISLVSSNNQIHIGINPSDHENSEALWKQKAFERMGKVFWTDVYTIKDSWNREAKVISLFRVINDINNVSHPIGMAVIRLDVKKLYEYIETDFGDLEKMMVVDRNGIIVMHSNPIYIGHPFPDSKITKLFQQDANQQTTLSYKEKNIAYNVVTMPVDDTDLITVGFVNEISVARGLMGIKQSIRCMMMVLTFLGVIAMLGLYHFNIKRIQDLIKQTQQVEKGDLTARVLVKSKDEIGILGIRFNKMVRRLKSLIENEYQMEIRTKESELKMLQSQINPHFLYNTLDMIRWTARLENAPETSKLIELLSKMFRTSLNRGKIWITLKDELSYCQNYLELQKRRLGDKLKYSLFCQYDVFDAIVLKQTIQPLIENSIHHGFENMKSLKKIYIRCFRENDFLIIDVMDNGKGFTKEQFATAVQNGFALKNMQDRLRIAFGKDAGISIEEGQTPGAWVRITFPFRNKEDECKLQKSAGDDST